MIAIIEHPRHGTILFDTGYAPHFHEATRKWPYRLYRWITPVDTSAERVAKQQLASRGHSADELQHVIVSPFHADHICGLADFPNARIIAHQDAWQSIQHMSGFKALRIAFLPQLVPKNLQHRLHLIRHFEDQGIGPFEGSYDLFNDGSIRLIELPGHATGQIGIYLHDELLGPVLLAADACWTSTTITQQLPATAAFRFLASQRSLARRTLFRLQAFSAQNSRVRIIPTHCPDVATEFGIEAAVPKSTTQSKEQHH